MATHNLFLGVYYFGVQTYIAYERAESLAQAARLRALRLQLDPHFLLNSLNAISTLIADRAEPIRRAIAS
jgi:two-component system sensor histidine kinase AlgZ